MLSCCLAVFTCCLLSVLPCCRLTVPSCCCPVVFLSWHTTTTQPPTNNTKITNNTNPPDPPQIPKNTEKKRKQRWQGDMKNMVKKRCKFVKKWPRRSPNWTQNGPKIEKKAFTSPKWHKMAPMSGLPQWWYTLLTHFWVPLGRPKITKNRLFPKKAVPGSAFSSIFAANVVFLDFSIDF